MKDVSIKESGVPEERAPESTMTGSTKTNTKSNRSKRSSTSSNTSRTSNTSAKEKKAILMSRMKSNFEIERLKSSAEQRKIRFRGRRNETEK